jgi:bacterioferritin-associated ferredoxin
VYACSCAGVTEKAVRETVAAGARTIDEIAVRCGAGSGCGGCWPILVDLLADAEETRAHVSAHSAA